jgi:hypothetical protein
MTEPTHEEEEVTITRTLTYHGKLSTLLYALEHRGIKGVYHMGTHKIVETWPDGKPEGLV